MRIKTMVLLNKAKQWHEANTTREPVTQKGTLAAKNSCVSS